MGELIGPVQNPSGSGASSACAIQEGRSHKEHKKDFMKDIFLLPFALYVFFVVTPVVLACSPPLLVDTRHLRRRHHVEGAFEAVVLTVVHDNLQLSGLVRYEAEGDHRIGAERDV